MTVSENISFIKSSRWCATLSIYSSDIFLNDFKVLGLISVGNSSDILEHLLAKSCGKFSSGTVLRNSLNFLSTGNARDSGNVKSRKHDSSSVGSRISFLNSASIAAFSLASMAPSTNSRCRRFSFLQRYFNYFSSNSSRVASLCLFYATTFPASPMSLVKTFH